MPGLFLVFLPTALFELEAGINKKQFYEGLVVENFQKTGNRIKNTMGLFKILSSTSLFTPIHTYIYKGEIQKASIINNVHSSS